MGSYSTVDSEMLIFFNNEVIGLFHFIGPIMATLIHYPFIEYYQAWLTGKALHGRCGSEIDPSGR